VNESHFIYIEGQMRLFLCGAHFICIRETWWSISSPLTRMYTKVSRLDAWSENFKWYSSLPL